MRAPIMVCHVTPDADALGSMLAMAMAWAADDCRPKVSVPEGSLSQRLEFMVSWSKPVVATRADFATADGFVVLDTAKASRCNVDAAFAHCWAELFGDVNWVVDRAGSSCELVYYLLLAAGRPVDPIGASLLYAGIQTDTLGFSLPTTSASTLRAAAGLVDAGADVGALGERIYRSQSDSEFALLRIVYDNTRVFADGQLAYSTASYDEIRSTGCAAVDIDDQINVPRSLDGVRLAMLFTEGRKGRTRINFRSEGEVTVLDLAAEFGGGGHRQAAGAILDCGVEEAVDRVLPRALEYLRTF